MTHAIDLATDLNSFGMEPSLHAVNIQTGEGINILLHLGIDTVKLTGKGFESFVKAGQRVKVGEPLIKMDLEQIKMAGYMTDIMMIVLAEDGLPMVNYRLEDTVTAGKTVIAEY